MTALPSRTYLLSQGFHENAVSAYDVCLRFEEQVAGDDKATIYARILGYLILHAPSGGALQQVVKEIHSCSEDYNRLSALGECFMNQFFRPFKKYKGRTPAPSSHPSQPSFDILKTDLRAKIQEAPKNHEDAKLKALIRDGFRCIVTGKYEMNAMLNPSLAPSLKELEQVGVVRTQCTHIVPVSTYFGVSSSDSNEKKSDYLCFGVGCAKALRIDVHDWFDCLIIWLEPTNVENRYKVSSVSTFSLSVLKLPEEVTFTTPDDINLPLPSRTLLALHAACAKVAHLSGAGEYTERIDREAEYIRVLANDGSSGEMLNNALFSRLNELTRVEA
ncbi:uncharacterized protein FIBRA_04573 [Fibroporia radiculosa]|uniref:HNH nuclease domain-containing protein n=1 Tax=Fibroporia radiculosa TaxID=599839 RepID=J4G7L3_9APHY|nr:uncharacterized protein FIBRA_04573 [Fibroporia radiculosa]CCM02473.1 predicted protein [Fibroporia radiculosa]